MKIVLLGYFGICLPWKLSACPFVEWYYHSSGEWDIFNEVWGEKSSRGRNWKIKRNIHKSHHISRISLSERDISVDLEYTMKEMKSILNYLKVLLFSKFRVSNIGISGASWEIRFHDLARIPLARYEWLTLKLGHPLRRLRLTTDAFDLQTGTTYRVIGHVPICTHYSSRAHAVPEL